MRMTIFAATIMVASLFGGVSEAALLGLNNTGGAGWNLQIGAGSVSPATTVATPNSLWGAQAGASWISNISNSQTGTSTPSTGPGGVGAYTFTTSFSFVAPLSDLVNLQFTMLFDDDVIATLENASGSFSLFSQVGNGAVLPAYTVAVNSANILRDGTLNTLKFVVNNIIAPVDPVNPVGLNVAFIAQEFGAIPEPTSVALWAGLCSLGLVVRSRRKR